MADTVSSAAIYIRQSRHKESERTASPEVQEQECRALPAVTACGDRVEVFKDLDLSGGKTAKRLGYLALLEKIKSGDVTVVAAYDQSRAFRNTSTALEFYALLERHPDIEVAFVHGRFDRSPTGGFSYAVLAAAHEMERRMTGEKIRAAYAYRNAQGAPTGPVPAGYRRIGTRADGHLEIDEEAAPVIRRAFTDYATGNWGTRSLAHRLNAEGAIVPGSKGWFADTLGQLLANVAYIGMTYTRSRRRREGALIRAQWPALIDRTTWDAVQRQLQSKRGRRGLRANSEPGREYAFRGLIVCGTCGRRMAIHNDRNRTYYRCRGIGAPDRCQGAWAREKKLLEWGDELFGRLDALRRSDFAHHLAAARDVKPQGPGAVTQVEAAIEKNRKLFSWSHITEAAYLAEHARLTAVRSELLARSQPQLPAVELEGLLDAWRTGLPTIRRELLGRLFDGLEVNDGQIVAYVPRKDREAAVTKLVDLAWPSEPQVMGFGGPGGI